MFQTRTVPALSTATSVCPGPNPTASDDSYPSAPGSGSAATGSGNPPAQARRAKRKANTAASLRPSWECAVASPSDAEPQEDPFMQPTFSHQTVATSNPARGVS